MRKVILALLFLFILQTTAKAQPVTFPSSQLQSKALELSGSQLNWPLLLKMAEHDPSTNQFTLDPLSIQKLKNFSRTTLTVEKAEDKINELIKGGASIFAKDELSMVNGVLTGYLNEVKNGNIDNAFEYAEELKPAVGFLDSALTANRLVDIQAQLAKKEGSVDKKIGILGSWNEAFEGDLFKETDGIKTYEDSYANMAFVDGSSIIINPQTQAVIRKSRIDKLDESADTEITLVEGGLLTKLSSAGKEKGKFILYAGSSETDLNTLNFAAETDADNRVKLTNYDGEANVKANDLTITIKKNEGTIVAEGEDPLPPIKLLPAPQLTEFTKDTIIYEDQYLYSFETVDGAVNYHIQYSSSSNFDNNVYDINTTNNTALLTNLSVGTNYVHVQAIDNLGLRGPYSRVIRVIRNQDNQPPPLFVTGATKNIIFTTAQVAAINGTTELDAILNINGKAVDVNENGSFNFEIETNPVDQMIEITSSDDSGNETKKQYRVVKLTDEVLFNLSVQGAILGQAIDIQQNPVTMSGSSYPELEVVIEINGKTEYIRTDNRGRWGISLPIEGDALTISFRNQSSKMVYSTKTFTVQSN